MYYDIYLFDADNTLFDLILNIASNDERIRLVGMEDSRTNVNVPRDKYQDYDISFIVNDMNSF